MAYDEPLQPNAIWQDADGYHLGLFLRLDEDLEDPYDYERFSHVDTTDTEAEIYKIHYRRRLTIDEELFPGKPDYAERVPELNAMRAAWAVAVGSAS